MYSCTTNLGMIKIKELIKIQFHKLILKTQFIKYYSKL